MLVSMVQWTASRSQQKPQALDAAVTHAHELARTTMMTTIAVLIGFARSLASSWPASWVMGAAWASWWSSRPAIWAI